MRLTETMMISVPIAASSSAMATTSSFSLLRNSLTLRFFQNSEKTSFPFYTNLADQTHAPVLRPFPRSSWCHIRATKDEEALATAAAAGAESGAPTIFDKIIAKEIPSTIVYEDEKVLAF